MQPAWPRPVPTVGDQTSAEQRRADPAGWALPDDARASLYLVMGERRDIRRFRPDPVPDEILTRVLGAAHQAPSVGHSQPWRFVVVTDGSTRARAALLADRARIAQAQVMDGESARHLLDLDLQGIREAPLGIVVCCDRRTPAEGVLGRATFPDADMWSCACAIQNLWLAARSEGLGVGWVTLFEPDDLAGLVGAPTGVATLGWLCVGWPDERPPSPGLERRGWSTRQPLGDVVLRESWSSGSVAPPRSRLAAPGQLHAPDPLAVVSAHDTGDVLLSPPGSLGVLDRAVDRVLAVRPAGLGTGRPVLVIAAADHPVTTHGVSAYEPGVGRTVAEAAVGGVSVGAVTAARSGLATVVVDAGLDGPPLAGGARILRAAGPRGDLVHDDGLAPADLEALLAGGELLARQLCDGPGGAPLVALGEIGIGNTTVAAALAAGLLGADPDPLVGLGAGSDSSMLAVKRDVVGRAVTRARRQAGCGSGGRLGGHQGLSSLGGAEMAVLAGIVIGAASCRSVVVLDGLATAAAALAAVAIAPAACDYLVAGQRSREPGHRAVLAEMGLEPLLDLRLRAGEGVGASLAVGMLVTALEVRAAAARTRSVHPGSDSWPGARRPR